MALIRSHSDALTKDARRCYDRTLMSEESPTVLRPEPGAGDCLGDDEIAVVREAPAGQVPAPLARHLAGCERCQRRVLAGGSLAEREREARPKREPPTLRRTLLLVCFILVALVLFVFSLQRLAAVVR